jgi:hypothetical protein
VTRATYRDTVGLAFSGDGVEARRFDRVGSDSRAMTICVINPNEVRDGKLTVDLGLLGADGLQAIWLDSDGRATHVHVAASARFETAVPSSIASALLLVGRVAPGEPRPAQIVATVAPGGARTTGWVATVVGAAPATATLEGLGGKAEIALSGAVGVTRIDRVWPTTQLDNGGDVTLSVGGQTAARAFCWPIVEDGSFETFPSPPAAGQPFHGRRFVQLPPAKGWQGVIKLLNVQPGAKYRFTVMGRRSGDKGTIYGLVRFRSQSQGWQYGALNFPPGRFNEWVRLQCELAAPADLVEADLYLYNSDSQETVDYDALRAEQP